MFKIINKLKPELPKAPPQEAQKSAEGTAAGNAKSDSSKA